MNIDDKRRRGWYLGVVSSQFLAAIMEEILYLQLSYFNPEKNKSNNIK